MKKILLFVMTGMVIISGLEASAFSFDMTKNIASTNEDIYDMVIIAPKIFVTDLQPLVDHKNNHGVKTFVKTTDDILSQYNGRDDAEKVKYFIKDAIDSWLTSNVLLVGAAGSGSTQLPVRDTHIYIDADEPDDEVFSSDLYYADMVLSGLGLDLHRPGRTSPAPSPGPAPGRFQHAHPRSPGRALR